MNTKHPPAGPDETEVRKHFGLQLKSDARLMRPAYTSVWALEHGTLLWDWRNGFANMDEGKDSTPFSSVPPETIKLKQVMYLTGPPASGKSTLASMIYNAVELNRGEFIGFTDLSRALSKCADVETIVVCYNSTTQKAFDMDNALRIWCRERKLKYFNINLTRTQPWKQETQF